MGTDARLSKQLFFRFMITDKGHNKNSEDLAEALGSNRYEIYMVVYPSHVCWLITPID
jgi:hypothetical protein